MNYDDLLRLGATLADQPDRITYMHVVRNELSRVVPADDILWIQAADTTGRGCLVLRGDPWQIDTEFSVQLSRYWSRHPHIQDYTRDPSNRVPRRISDILAPRRWRQREEFQELRAGMHEHQLSIIPPPPYRYRGWLIGRDRHDFNDDDLETAAAIAPILAATAPLYDRIEPWQKVADRPTNATGLTARELAVLSALADGLAARTIGHRLGMSQRTVDKHLEHIYRKLECNDRLIAVMLARSLGLLPPPDPYWRKATRTQDARA